jgi:hypothetical protein
MSKRSSTSLESCAAYGWLSAGNQQQVDGMSPGAAGNPVTRSYLDELMTRSRIKGVGA